MAHVQIGDVPGRHQPGTGEVNHANLLKAVRAAGYRGKIGLEFMPLDQDDAKAVSDTSRRRIQANEVRLLRHCQISVYR